jgi:hypothetical protein
MLKNIRERQVQPKNVRLEKTHHRRILLHRPEAPEPKKGVKSQKHQKQEKEERPPDNIPA